MRELKILQELCCIVEDEEENSIEIVQHARLCQTVAWQNMAQNAILAVIEEEDEDEEDCDDGYHQDGVAAEEDIEDSGTEDCEDGFHRACVVEKEEDIKDSRDELDEPKPLKRWGSLAQLNEKESEELVKPKTLKRWEKVQLEEEESEELDEPKTLRHRGTVQLDEEESEETGCFNIQGLVQWLQETWRRIWARISPAHQISGGCFRGM